MPKRIFFAFLAITVIVGIVVTRIVLGERGVEVGKQLGREHIVPVEGHVAVAPSHVSGTSVSRRGRINVFILCFLFVIRLQDAV